MLTVLSVAYPLTPVGPDAVGGSEQILTLMDTALTRSGHRSLVVACEGSRTAGTLLPTPFWTGKITEEVRLWAQEQHRIAIEQALKKWHVDVIHMHSLDFWTYLPSGSVPVLTTLHLPPDWYPPKVFRVRRQNYYLNGVSRTQTSNCPARAKLLPHIDNGVDIDRLTVGLRKRDFALALGRICPEKGLHQAIDAARLAGVPLLLAGQVYRYEAHERYFETELAPRLDAQRRFIGPAGFRKKRRLLTQARCLLIPSLVAETSSLVAMEAMSCGTPVIAYRSGALPEIIEDGRTGFIVENESEMASAIRAVKFIDPEVCRQRARERFSAERMTGRYMQRYAELIQSARRTRASTEATTAAIWSHAQQSGG
ncbi:MAG: glycosyltransferase family 4 protein [Bryobacteraceae bacterium]